MPMELSEATHCCTCKWFEFLQSSRHSEVVLAGLIKKHAYGELFQDTRRNTIVVCNQRRVNINNVQEVHFSPAENISLLHDVVPRQEHKIIK